MLSCAACWYSKPAGRGLIRMNGGNPYRMATQFAQIRATRPLPFAYG